MGPAWLGANGWVGSVRTDGWELDRLGTRAGDSRLRGNDVLECGNDVLGGANDGLGDRGDERVNMNGALVMGRWSRGPSLGGC